MVKRGKLWRRQQEWCRYKRRMLRLAGWGKFIIDNNGEIVTHPHWFELAMHKSSFVYKRTGTPCSCYLCRGECYNRTGYKKETRRIIGNSMEQQQHSYAARVI